MGRMVMYGALVIGSFGLAAGGSWFLNQKEEDKTEQTEGDGEGEDAVEQLGDDTAEAIPQELPSAVPPKALSAEHLYRMGAVMNTREKAIAQREAELEKEDRRLQLALMDIEVAQQTVDGTLVEIRGTLDESERKLVALQQAQAEAMQMKPAEGAVKEDEVKPPDEKKMQAYKRQAQVYAGMDPAKAAAQLTKLANEGNMEDVVWIVSQLEQRKHSKLLEAMPDEGLAVEIARRSLEIRQPEKKKKRR